MGGASGLQNDLMDVAPALDVSELFSLGECELLRELNFVSLVIEHEQALWHDSSGMEDTSKGGSEEMTLLAVERWVGVNISVEVTSEDVLDQTSLLHVLGLTVWQLDPIVQKVIGNPEHCLVDTLATSFHSGISGVLLSLGKSTDGDPVVARGTKDLATEAQSLSTAHNCQSL